MNIITLAERHEDCKCIFTFAMIIFAQMSTRELLEKLSRISFVYNAIEWIGFQTV